MTKINTAFKKEALVAQGELLRVKIKTTFHPLATESVGFKGIALKVFLGLLIGFALTKSLSKPLKSLKMLLNVAWLWRTISKLWPR